MVDKPTWFFEKRAIAFLDILGFKEMMPRFEASVSELQKPIGLKTVLECHAKFDKERLALSIPDKVKPKYIFISDSMIL